MWGYGPTEEEAVEMAWTYLTTEGVDPHEGEPIDTYQLRDGEYHLARTGVAS